jgi:hypothetical protein
MPIKFSMLTNLKQISQWQTFHQRELQKKLPLSFKSIFVDDLSTFNNFSAEEHKETSKASVTFTMLNTLSERKFSCSLIFEWKEK